MVKEEVINRSVSGGSVKWFAHCMTSELFESEMLRDCNNGSNIRFERWIADPEGALPERSAFKPFEQGHVLARSVDLNSKLDIPWMLSAFSSYADCTITVQQRACYDADAALLELRQWSITQGTPLDDKVHCEASITLKRPEAASKSDRTVELEMLVRTSCTWDNWMGSKLENFVHAEHLAWFEEFADRLMRNATDPTKILQSHSVVSAIEIERGMQESQREVAGADGTNPSSNQDQDCAAPELPKCFCDQELFLVFPKGTMQDAHAAHAAHQTSNADLVVEVEPRGCCASSPLCR